MPIRPALTRPPCLLALCLLAGQAQAGQTLAFDAHYEGQTQIVEVINPALPLLRFATEASGSASFGLLSYFSTDVVDMSTGVGSGSNRFVGAAGDALFGSFSVQVLPVSPGVVDLVGTLLFTGGTGLFAGASGSAGFSGHGQFINDSTALSSFDFHGAVAVVPEPAVAGLLLAGLLAGAALRRWGAARTARLSPGRRSRPSDSSVSLD